jgi:16S rRNA (guanine966-N2)-methyltransferase
VREAVFSALASLDAIDGASVLDLFAGSGAFGIEALSRGAGRATFVDEHPDAITAVRSNLAATGFAGDVVRANGVRWLETAPAFDLAFADPPYRFDRWVDVFGRLTATVAVFESDRDLDPGDRWRVLRTKRYGDTVVTIAHGE